MVLVRELAKKRRWGLIVDALDLVIRRARVATAADTFDSDIGIKDGVVVMLGKNLPKATKEIDAAGRVVTPRRD